MTATEPALLDLNVLIALAWPQHVHHTRAHQWFAGWGRPWATSAITEAGFVRLSMNAAVVGAPVSAASALASLAAMRSVPGHTYVADHSTLAEPAIALDRLATSRQVTDAHLVNLAARAGSVLATFDRRILDLLEPTDRHHVMVLPA